MTKLVQTGSHQRATVDLLWAAARPHPNLDAIRAASAEGADLEAVAICALLNRVGPLCWRNLRAAAVDLETGEAGAMVKQDAMLRRLQSELLIPHALELMVGPLVDIGLDPLVVKGAALIDRYPAQGLRPMDDIDIILPKAQHRVALGALTRSGWAPVRTRLGDHYDSYLVHPDVPDLPLELHWELARWRDRSNSLHADFLWEKRRPQEMAGTAAFGLAPEEELVALAAHAGKPFHYFNRLVWSVDIAVVIDDAGETLDWDTVASHARRFRCETVMAVALEHAKRLGASVQDQLFTVRRGRTRQLALQPLIDADWPFAEPDVGTAHRLRYALSDSWARQLQLLLGEITDVPREIPIRMFAVIQRAARRWNRDRKRGNEL